MGFLTTLASDLSGGLVGEIRKTVEDYLPPAMTPQQKADLDLKLQQIADARAAQIDSAQTALQTEFDQRIRDLEGTANDLKSFPVLGPLMLLLRGAFRPLFSYCVAFFDLQVFSGAWRLSTPQIESSFWVVNLLVLGFFFGERALQNILPLLKQLQLGSPAK